MHHYLVPVQKQAAKYQAGEITIDELTGNNANKGACKIRKCYLQASDLKYKWKIQGYKCAWFGFKLDPNDVFIPHHPLAISVDRIDDELDYTFDNTILCCRYANLGRNIVDFSTTKQLILDMVKRISEIDYNSFSPGMEHTHKAVKPKTKTLW